MEKLKQFNSNNNAYRKYYNTATAIIQISDAIYQAADEKTIANILTMDESATFDTISHEILQTKIELYNFGPKARLWMRNNMSYRSQYVSIGNSNSTMKEVKQGVPQGSVIGPLIYTIYINEMPAILEDIENCEEVTHSEEQDSLFPVNCKKCGIVPSFADDLTVVTGSNNRDENQVKLRETLNTMNRFLSANRLTINETKTKIVEVMVPRKRARTRGSPPYLDTVGENGEMKRINAEKYTRILGYNIQDNLTMNAHLATGEKHLLGQIRQKLGAIKHLGKQLPSSCRKTL